MAKEFNYVIARPWNKDEPDNLCIYAYGSQVHRGTMEGAKSLLEYVRLQRESIGRKYDIYKVTFEKIEV